MISVNPYSLTSGTSGDYLGISNVLAFFLSNDTNFHFPKVGQGVGDLLTGA